MAHEQIDQLVWRRPKCHGLSQCLVQRFGVATVCVVDQSLEPFDLSFSLLIHFLAPFQDLFSYTAKLPTALAQLIGPWEGERPPLITGQARISLLTPSGLHFGQAAFETLAQDTIGAPVIAAATRLMQALIELAKPAK